MLKALIVDDSGLFRKSLAKAVENFLEVVAFGKDGNEGFEQYKALKPDVVLLDITMPNCDGMDCLAKIRAHDPNAKVVMISGLESEHIIEECLSLGALGYVPKGCLALEGSQEGGQFAMRVMEAIRTRAAV